MRQAAERLMARAFEGERVLQLGPDAPANRTVERVATVRQIMPGIDATPAGPVADPPSAVVEEARRIARPSETTGVAPTEAVREAREAAAPPAYAPADRSTSGQHSLIPPERAALSKALQEAMRANTASGTMLRETPAQTIGAPAGQARRAEESAPAPAAPHEATKSLDAAPAQKPEQVAMSGLDAHGDAEESPRPVYRVIGVVLKTYILIEANDSLVMIDQHAAHERLNYERLMAGLEAGRGSQQLLTPLVVHLTAREMALVKDNLEVLSEAGYTVEPFGEQDIQVRAVPYILGKADLRPAFMDTISALNRVRLATVDLRRAEIMQMSCKAAVKGGDQLSEGEIESLVRQMLETGAPPTCPHGRPVMKAIPRRELEKMFKRIQ